MIQRSRLLSACGGILMATLIGAFAPSLLPAQDRPVSFSSVAEVSDLTYRLDQLEQQFAQFAAAPSNAVPEPSLASHSSACPICNFPLQHCTCAYDKPSGGTPSVRVTGFFHLDAGLYNQDAVNRATLGDIADGAGFRRARLAATGNVSDRTSFMMEFDFAQFQARFVDVWMQFKDTPLGNVRVGRYRQPFGMTELTSIRELPFLERPLLFALSPFRQTGVMLFDTALDERMTWAVSGYRYLSDNFGNDYADTGGYGLASRLTMLALDAGDDRIVHLGVDYSYNDPGRDEVLYASPNEFFVGQNPELGPPGLSVLPVSGVPTFVNTGIMPTDRTNLFNVEGAVSLGRLLLQSEARWAVVDLKDGTQNTFPGAYAHLRYVLTGETIPYNRQAGVFGRVKPAQPADIACGYWGAWEVAARVSYLDLNGIGLPGPGRRLTDVTVGLNWYLSDHVKFQFNWIYADLDDPTLGGSNAETYAFRGQIDY